jgi:hypothetical protein
LEEQVITEASIYLAVTELAMTGSETYFSAIGAPFNA